MRNYQNFDSYLNILAGEIYHQPEDPGHTRLSKKVIDHWLSRMTTCHSVLDVGCGTAFGQAMFEKWGLSYEGICLGEDYVVGRDLGRNVKKMDYTFMDFPDNYVDLIFSRHSLEHSPFPVITLMEWRRVAKNWLGIVLPAPEWYTYVGQNHYAVMNLLQIRHLLDVAGWNIMWEDIHFELFDKENPDSRTPNEYWIMCEKKRG